MLVNSPKSSQLHLGLRLSDLFIDSLQYRTRACKKLEEGVGAVVFFACAQMVVGGHSEFLLVSSQFIVAI